jgi:hypothetical protein
MDLMRNGWRHVLPLLPRGENREWTSASRGGVTFPREERRGEIMRCFYEARDASDKQKQTHLRPWLLSTGTLINEKRQDVLK